MRQITVRPAAASALWEQSTATARLAMNVAMPRRTLFFISHMRSYSSVLCHILNSNADIDGYGELGIPYRTPLDLLNMRYQIVLTTGRPLKGRYTLDKLLHADVEPARPILVARSTTLMAGIREPAASVRSIVAMGRAKRKPDWKADPDRAARHYLNRLDYIARVVDQRRDTLVFPTDALIVDTDAFLAGLSHWLGLKQGLVADYEVGEMTGRSGFGDTSPHISSGSVTSERSGYDVELPAQVLDRVWSAYERTMDKLQNRAQHVLCPDSRMVREE